MKITCISDLHGYYPDLEGGDLLIVAGDLTARDEPEQYADFVCWLTRQRYKKRIVIGGNHDNFLQDNPLWADLVNLGFTYLCDSGTEFEGLKIWGSPWTSTFKGINPNCCAFTVDTEEELAEKWASIPEDIDILITHSPIQGVLDKTIRGENVGSKSLRRMLGKVKPKLWVTAHIHESYGEFKDTTLAGIEYYIINASHVNERYQPVNKPIQIEI